MKTDTPNPALTEVVAETYAPGLWRDGNGNIHLNATVVLARAGMPATEENMRMVNEMQTEMVRQVHPDVQVIYRTVPGATPPLN